MGMLYVKNIFNWCKIHHRNLSSIFNLVYESIQFSSFVLWALALLEFELKSSRTKIFQRIVIEHKVFFFDYFSSSNNSVDKSILAEQRYLSCQRELVSSKCYDRNSLNSLHYPYFKSNRLASSQHVT